MSQSGAWARFSFTILTGVFLLMVGCSNQAPSTFSPEGVLVDNSVTAEEGIITTLYYITRQGGYMVPIKQKLCASDRPVRLTLGRLIGGLEADDDLIAPIPAETQVRDLYIRDGIAYVDLSSEFVGNQAADDRYAQWAVETLVQTITQFDNIDKVQLLINGKVKEKMATGVDISEPLKPKEWLNPLDDGTDGQMVLLYFDYRGKYLVPISRSVGLLTESLSRTALEELIKGPQGLVGLNSVVPDNVHLLNYRVEQETAYIDLDLGEVGEDADNWDESRALRSMLFTLQEFPHIHNVQLLVRGKIVGYLNGRPDLGNTQAFLEVNLMGN